MDSKIFRIADLSDSHNGILQVVKDIKADTRKIVSAESRQTKKPAPHDQNSDLHNQWVLRLPHGSIIGPFSSVQLSSWHNRFYGPEIEVRFLISLCFLSLSFKNKKINEFRMLRAPSAAGILNYSEFVPFPCT